MSSPGAARRQVDEFAQTMRTIKVQNLSALRIEKRIDTTKVRKVQHLSTLGIIGDFFDSSQKLPPLHRVKWLVVDDAAALSDDEPAFLEPESEIPDVDRFVFQFVITAEVGGITHEDVQRRPNENYYKYLCRLVFGRPRYYGGETETQGEGRGGNGESLPLRSLTLQQSRSLLYDGVFIALPDEIKGLCVPCDSNPSQGDKRDSLLSQGSTLRRTGKKYCLDVFGYGEPVERWDCFWSLIHAVWELPASEWLKYERESGGTCFSIHRHREPFARELFDDLMYFKPDLFDMALPGDTEQRVPSVEQDDRMCVAVVEAANLTIPEYGAWVKSRVFLEDEPVGCFGLFSVWKEGFDLPRDTLMPHHKGHVKVIVADILRKRDVLNENAEQGGAAAGDSALHNFCDTITHKLFRVKDMATTLQLKTRFVQPRVTEEFGLIDGFLIRGTTNETKDVLQEVARIIRGIKTRLQRDFRHIADDLQLFRDEFVKRDFDCTALFAETIDSLRNLAKRIGLDHDVDALDELCIRQDFEDELKKWISSKRPRMAWELNLSDIKEMWKVHDLADGDTPEKDAEQFIGPDGRFIQPSSNRSSLKSYASAKSERSKSNSPRKRLSMSSERYEWVHGRKKPKPDLHRATRRDSQEPSDALFRTPDSQEGR